MNTKKIIILVFAAIFCNPLSACAQKKSVKKTVVESKKDTLAILTEKAIAGDAVAQNTLGTWYYYGRNVQKDHATAAKWWSKSADQGNMYAIGNLAMCYQLGNGTKQDSALAMKLYETSMKKGNKELVAQHEKLAEKKENTFSNMLMYEAYNNGYGVKRDAGKAAIYLEHLAEMGDDDYQYRVALHYLNNSHADKAVRWFKAASQHGNVGATYYYGMLLHSGMGITQDKEKGIRLMEAAERKGFLAADNQLGRIFYEGDGVEQDFTKAVNYLQKAAPSNGKSQWLLGLCYLKGNGVSQNYYLAAQWLAESAKAYEKEFDDLLKEDKSEAFLQYLMGLKHYYVDKNFDAAIACFKKVEKAKVAEGVTMQALCLADKDYAKNNIKKAVKLFNKVAERSPLASYYLSNYYDEGTRVKKDADKALDLLNDAADKGIAPAQCKLGDMYMKGRGVPKDYIKAAQLYLAAESQRHLTLESAKNLAKCYSMRIAALPDLDNADKRIERLNNQKENTKLVTFLKNLAK